MNRELLRQAPAVRAWLLVTVVVGVLAAAVTIAQMTLLSHVVARVFLAHATREQVAAPLALLLAAIGARAALVWLREVTAQQGAIHAKSFLRERLFAHLLRLGPAYTTGERTGELVVTAVEGIERLDPYVSRYLPQVFLSVCVPLLVAAYVLPLDWASAVLLLVTGPIIPLLMILIGSYSREHMQRQWLALSRMSAHFLDTVQGLPTLKLFGQGAAERGRVARIGEAYREKTMKVLRFAFLSGLALEFMAAIAIALIAVTLGVRLLDGGISFERAFLVLLLAPEFYRPLRDLGAHHHAGMEGGVAAARIMDILRTPHPPAPVGCVPPPLEGEGEKKARGGRCAPMARTFPHEHLVDSRAATGDTHHVSPLPAEGGGTHPTGPGVRGITVELSDVAYTYPDATRPALEGVSLTLSAGSCTALVGRSGAGKSTLANLLLRFVEPQHGAITVNGIAIADLPVEAWRAYVALVPQRPYLFHGSVRDNIRLARPTASDDDVMRAAELAGAAEFIARLPHGYDTPVGERGARLSAGQAQRIAIARAFLKDAPLLVLDEPTSSLDPESEALIARALERLMRDRTVLVIAHRLNTIDRADAIAVLDDGRLVETGTHAALLRRDGLYARLIGAYREELVPA